MEVSAAMRSKEIAFDKHAMMIFADALPTSYGVLRSQILRNANFGSNGSATLARGEVPERH